MTYVVPPPRRAAAARQPGRRHLEEEIRAFVKERLGSVKTPKQVEIWPDLPRSKVGKVLKTEVKAQLRDAAEAPSR